MVGRQRLGVGHVERGAEAPAFELGDEGVGVDERTPADIHDERTVGQLRERGGIEDVLGRLATQVVAPRLGMPRFVPGPPKRFAQSIGLVLTTVAAVAAYGFGLLLLPTLLVAVLLLFALLVSVLGFCAGCWLFGHLMRLGVIPADTCEACNNVQQRYAASRA